MPQGSDPRRRPDQQSSDPGPNGPPSWWPTLWQDRLPRELDEPAPPITARLAFWSGRVLLGLAPVLVVAAVVLASFRLVPEAVGAGVAAAVIVVGAVSQPIWERARSGDEGGWG